MRSSTPPSRTTPPKKTPENNRLILQLLNGETRILKTGYRAIDKKRWPYYVDKAQKKEYIIKNTDNLTKEYLGAIIFRALGINVPDFFLAVTTNTQGQKHVVFMQQLLHRPKKIGPHLNNAQLHNIMFSMTWLVTATALLGDPIEFFFDSEGIRVHNQKIYKLENGQLFNEFAGNINAIFIKLFNPEQYSNNRPATTARILANYNFQYYKSIIDHFFASLSSEHLIQLLNEAYHHPLLKDHAEKEFPFVELFYLCKNLAEAIKYFPTSIDTMLENLYQNSMHCSQQGMTFPIYQHPQDLRPFVSSYYPYPAQPDHFFPGYAPPVFMQYTEMSYRFQQYYFGSQYPQNLNPTIYCEYSSRHRDQVEHKNPTQQKLVETQEHLPKINKAQKSSAYLLRQLKHTSNQQTPSPPPITILKRNSGEPKPNQDAEQKQQRTAIQPTAENQGKTNTVFTASSAFYSVSSKKSGGSTEMVATTSTLTTHYCSGPAKN